MNWGWDLFPQILRDLVLAGFLAYIAYQQLRLGRRQTQLDRLRLKHQLYDRRIKIYDSTVEFLEKMLQDPAKIEASVFYTFQQRRYQSAFLFGDEISQYMNEVQLKARAVLENHLALEESQPIGNTALFKWVMGETRQAREKFAPYMKMDEEI